VPATILNERARRAAVCQLIGILVVRSVDVEKEGKLDGHETERCCEPFRPLDAGLDTISWASHVSELEPGCVKAALNAEGWRFACSKGVIVWRRRRQTSNLLGAVSDDSVRRMRRFMHSLRAFSGLQIARITRHFAMVEGKKETEVGVIPSVKFAA
jgi:hypothetical protein